jgi:hypothetical protein
MGGVRTVERVLVQTWCAMRYRARRRLLALCTPYLAYHQSVSSLGGNESGMSAVELTPLGEIAAAGWNVVVMMAKLRLEVLRRRPVDVLGKKLVGTWEARHQGRRGCQAWAEDSAVGAGGLSVWFSLTPAAVSVPRSGFVRPTHNLLQEGREV